MAGPRPRVTALVCAYNEVANIAALLKLLVGRDRACFDELIVVSSASTDGTDEVVRAFEASDHDVRLLAEPVRRGKAAAVNIGLRASTGDIVLLIDADCLPAPRTLERLVARFRFESTGGAGSRNVVTNPRETWVARAGHALWELHHEVCLRQPVLGGDIVAFRRVVDALPEGTINDDYAIEAALKLRGLGIEYEPEARVLMRVPTTLRDFMVQRRRISAGFKAATQRVAIKATEDPRIVLAAAADLVRRRPALVPWLFLASILAIVARESLRIDGMLGRRRTYSAWQPTPTTKRAIVDVTSKQEGRQTDE